MGKCCEGCVHDLGGGYCRINMEAECHEGGGFELRETIYDKAKNELTDALTKADVKFCVKECFDGWQITFDDLPEADMVCHYGSYGGQAGLWEAYWFPQQATETVEGFITTKQALCLVKDALLFWKRRAHDE